MPIKIEEAYVELTSDSTVLDRQVDTQLDRVHEKLRGVEQGWRGAWQRIQQQDAAKAALAKTEADAQAFVRRLDTMLGQSRSGFRGWQQDLEAALTKVHGKMDAVAGAFDRFGRMALKVGKLTAATAGAGLASAAFGSEAGSVVGAAAGGAVVGGAMTGTPAGAAIGAAMLGGAQVVQEMIASVTGVNQAADQYAAAMSAAAQRAAGTSPAVEAALQGARARAPVGGERAMGPAAQRTAALNAERNKIDDELRRVRNLSEAEAGKEFGVEPLLGLGMVGELADVFDRGPRQRAEQAHAQQIARQRAGAVERLMAERAAIDRERDFEAGQFAAEQAQAEIDRNAELMRQQTAELRANMARQADEDIRRQQEAERVAAFEEDLLSDAEKGGKFVRATTWLDDVRQMMQGAPPAAAASQRFGIEELSSRLQQAALGGDPAAQQREKQIQALQKIDENTAKLPPIMEKALDKPAVFADGGIA